MRKNLMAATALASSLVLAAALTASAAPAFNLKNAQGTSTGTIELVKSGGGGGHGGHGGGGHGGGGHGGGGHGGGGGHHMSGGGGHGHGHGHMGGGGGGHGHFAGHHGKHGKNFRHFGSDIFVYGGGGYGYSDCGWLRRQAVITGSPYWWRRYQDCLYYD